MLEVDRLQANALLERIRRAGLTDEELKLAMKHQRGEAEVPDAGRV